MTLHEAGKAVLFTPGRASYIDEENNLQLTEASENRSEMAAIVFDGKRHNSAVYAGGYPGVQNWPIELIPPIERREAGLMSLPLVRRLVSEGKSARRIAALIHIQGRSTDTFGDIVLSVEDGLLDPDEFNTDFALQVDVVAGLLQGIRVRSVLSKTLDIDRKRIHRVRMSDIYGTPAYPHQPAKSAALAVAEEVGAVIITEKVLRKVKPGDLEGIKDAQQNFFAAAAKLGK